ncbi:MAG TPA: CBS domain-containing protein [Gaiellaceae bacterium]|nr:CBS domain-containing protein [Gaiellaceae bacterium]
MRIGEVMSVRLVSVGPDDPVSLAVARMNEENVGSVTVCDGPELVGIFTERDLVRLAGEGSRFAEVRISEVMTRRPVTVSPDDDIVSAARLMGERRIRHLPVVQDGFLLGVIGIRDVMGSLVERVWRDRDDAARETARELLRR